MTSPLCPPCSRLHELVREWHDADVALDAAHDAYYSEFEGGDRQSLDDAQKRYDWAYAALRAAAQQLPDAAAHRPDVPAGSSAREADEESSNAMCFALRWYGFVATPDELRDDGGKLARETLDACVAPAESCPAGSLQTDHGASIAACAQQDRHPLLYALIQSGADVCAAIEAVLTERA